MDNLYKITDFLKHLKSELTAEINKVDENFTNRNLHIKIKGYSELDGFFLEYEDKNLTGIYAKKLLSQDFATSSLGKETAYILNYLNINNPLVLEIFRLFLELEVRIFALKSTTESELINFIPFKIADSEMWKEEPETTEQEIKLSPETETIENKDVLYARDLGPIYTYVTTKAGCFIINGKNQIIWEVDDYTEAMDILEDFIT